jgi:hypothetical protein
MSARSCSLACRVFFKRDPRVLEEAPHRPVARRCAALGQFGHHRPQRQVWLLSDPRQQPLALALQPQLPPPAHLFGRRAAARAPALRPRRGWNVLGGGLFRDVTAERLVKALSKASALCRPGLHQTRARTSQFAAGKNTPCELVYFWKKTSRAARTASR